MPKKWRHWIRAFHRDIGYFLSALVVAYAISGAAVNHIDDWNPSYAMENRSVDVGPVTGEMDAMRAEIIRRLELDPATATGHHLVADNAFVVFLRGGGEARIDPKTGQGHLQLITPRRPLFDFNVLHLNHIKGGWTWFADAFALLLLTLAITGLFMLKGKVGLSGRGKWFVLAGLVAPVGFLVAHYMSQ
jgi:uncharacterized protein